MMPILSAMADLQLPFSKGWWQVPEASGQFYRYEGAFCISSVSI